MRGMRLLAAAAIVAALAVTAVEVVRSLSGALSQPPAPVRAQEPVDVAAGEAERRCAGYGGQECMTRRQWIADLAARLSTDPAVLGDPIVSDRDVLARAVERRGPAAARRLRDSICPDTSRRDECHQAVSREAVRLLWRAMRPSHRHARKARELIVLGGELRMTGTEVQNAVRAELDEALTSDVRAGALTEHGHAAAIACFDRPERCELAALAP